MSRLKRMFAPAPDLVPGEVLILLAMRDGNWFTAEELGEITGLAPFALRSMLKELVRRGLAHKSFHSSTPTELSSWTLTGSGQLEATAQTIAAEDQP